MRTILQTEGGGGAIKGTVVNISRDLINIVKEIVLLNFENFL